MNVIAPEITALPLPGEEQHLKLVVKTGPDYFQENRSLADAIYPAAIVAVAILLFAFAVIH